MSAKGKNIKEILYAKARLNKEFSTQILNTKQ